MRNCVKIEIFLRNLLHKWEMAIFLVQGTAVYNRVSQKIQKSEFWNATYPSGFHRLDEPPDKISAL